MTKVLERVHFSSAQIIIAGFATVILLGAALLTLPFASRVPGSANFSDALFTATSAVCVTGLVVQDTALYWSEFGQAVILILIQIGGMGVVTVAVAIAMISGKKISLMQRSTMQEAISAHHVGGVVRLTGFIVRGSLLIELVGAMLLAIVFVPEFGVGQGVWYSVFHSISAFCNAGFDLMGVRAPYSSLVAYAGNPVVSLTIAGLIVVGGIGFLTWEDIRTNGLHLRAYRLQSKVILCVTFALIVLPAAYFYAFELSDALPVGERVLSALFQSITPRTAGFNTIDLTALSEVGQMVLVMLMLIGGSPGSTAGGMKTTTLAVLLFSAAAVFSRREEPRCFGRRIEGDALRNGADEVVYPEKQLAAWTAIRYSSDHIFDYIELNADHAIVEVAVPEAWAGRTVGDLDVRRKYGLNVLAVKRQGKMNANVASDTMLLREDTVLVLGSNQAIQRCFHL